MPLRTAFHHCPEAVFLPVDYAHYVKISQQIKEILTRFSSRIEDVGIDEAFLDITDSSESPEQIARAIKQQINAETGLTCSVGIAPNKLLAKIASDLEKPDGLTQLDDDDIPSRVWPLPVRRLWGVGPKTELRLARLGVSTIGNLAALPLETLLQHFGKAQGHYLHQASQGIDESPITTKREHKSISEETTFQYDLTDIPALSHILSDLSHDVVARLQHYHFKARTVSIKLRFNDFETHTRSQTLGGASDDFETIEHAAQQCFKRIKLSKPVRLIGVRLGHFETHKNKKRK
jgi:DNA polymerase-4